MDNDRDRNASPAAGPLGAVAALPARSKAMLATGSALLAATIVATAMWARTPDYRVLFSNLSDRDGGSVIAALSQMNVPYRFGEAGGIIMVPADKVHDIRLKLASQGLPKGGTVGFELMENQRFGVTQFQERLNYQRGLEGELARSIQALAAVGAARVHLALPSGSAFFREQQKPSASVLLTLHPGRVLDRAQIAGIVHLVASSVPEMQPRQVSVIDQTGALLSQQGEGAPGTGLDPTQLQYVRSVEQSYVARILEIIEPIVGRGNVRAQVTADVDFTLSESTAEHYSPNQNGAPAAVRSQQIVEAPGAGGAAQGVPGALSNQPPAQATAPINGPGQPLAALQQPAAGAAAAPAVAAAAATGPGRREALTNFEVDKTVRVTRNASGAIKRLTAAVVIDHRRGVDAEGRPTTTPLEPREIEQIQSLVREAIGYTKDRGDSLNVVNAPFTVQETPKPEPVPVWKDPELLTTARSVGGQIALVLVALATIFGLIRPALKSRTRAAARPANAVVENDVALPAPTGGPPLTLAALPRPDDVMRLARENPATVANVVRNWVNA